MVSSSERRKLLKSMNGEPAGAWFILAKCAAGLAVTVLIAVIGASEKSGLGDGNAAKIVVPAAAQYAYDDHEDGFDPLPKIDQATAAPSRHVGDSQAQSHRKQVFDQRRARFDGGADTRSVAGVTVRPSNHLSTVLQ